MYTGLFWNETLAHLRKSKHECSQADDRLFVARCRADDAWQRFMTTWETYCTTVWPESVDPEVQTIIERVYANQLMYAAQIVELRMTQLFELEVQS